MEYKKKLAEIAVKSKKKKKKNKTIFKSRYFRFQTWVCYNVSNEFLSAWFKFWAKILTHFGVLVHGEWHKYTRLFPPLRFYVWFAMTVYYKMRQILLQNATAVLLQDAPGFLSQNSTAIRNCDNFITKCNCY